MRGQKQAVLEYVHSFLPGFKPGDVALVMLSKAQLEQIKLAVARDIEAGAIEYGKDKHNWAEVRAYARSMVMNHLKKAKELNGGQVYGKTVAQVRAVRQNKALAGIDMDILPADVCELVKTLV